MRGKRGTMRKPGHAPERGRPRRIHLAVALSALAVLALSAPSLAGARTLKFQGCMTLDRHIGAPCTVARDAGAGLVDLRALTLSPDHRSLYSGTSMDCHTVNIDYEYCNLQASVGRFRAKSKNGALRYHDCVGAYAGCTHLPSGGLGAVWTLAVSPDSDFLYAGAYGICGVVGYEGDPGRCYGSDVLTTFERDPMTGELTFDGCVTGDERLGPGGSGTCTLTSGATSQGYNSGFDDPSTVVVGPGGTSLYLTSESDDSVVAFQRNPATGALAYRGCITGEAASGPSGSGACTAIPSATEDGENSGLDHAYGLAVSPDGSSVYVTGENDASLATFVRDPHTSALTYEGCVTGEMAVHDSGACAALPSDGARSALRRPRSVAVSPDGESVYVGASGVAQFDRSPTTGALQYVRKYGHAYSPMTLTNGGNFLYAAVNTGVARFKRHAGSGRLTRTDCVTGSSSYASRTRCRKTRTATRTGEGSGLDYPVALAATNRRVYVAARDDSAIARLVVKRRR
jgi:DNA-binding beta-propeller fold protein YncE